MEGTINRKNEISGFLKDAWSIYIYSKGKCRLNRILKYSNLNSAPASDHNTYNHFEGPYS